MLPSAFGRRILQKEGPAPSLSLNGTFSCLASFSSRWPWPAPTRVACQCRASSRRRAQSCRGPKSWAKRAAATSSYRRIAAGRPVAQFGSWSRTPGALTGEAARSRRLSGRRAGRHSTARGQRAHRRRFHPRRDILVVSQRGTMFSKPALTCAAIGDFNRELLGLRFYSEIVQLYPSSPRD